MAPEVKAEAERRAAEERRTFASYLEWLIMKDAAANPPPVKAKAPARKRA